VYGECERETTTKDVKKRAKKEKNPKKFSRIERDFSDSHFYFGAFAIASKSRKQKKKTRKREERNTFERN
jgi:hypothetical protein